MNRIIALACMCAACCGASAANVIREWGGEHSSPAEYQIIGNLHIEIYRNDNPAAPWKFEAWNTETGEEGTIDSITIVSTEPVGGIDLRIEPEPNSPYGTHPYGAGYLKRLDLVTNGNATNHISTLRLRYDYGDVDFGVGGPMRAARAGTIFIGHDVVAPSGVTAINVGAVTGSLEIGGDILSPVNITHVVGDLTVGGDVRADFTVGRVWGTTTIQGLVLEQDEQHPVTFACSEWVGGDVRLTSSGVHTGHIELSNVPGAQGPAPTCSVSAGHTLTCSGYAAHLKVRTLPQGAMVHLEQGAGEVMVADGSPEIRGTLWIQGNVTSLECEHIMSNGAVCVEGVADEVVFVSAAGDVTLGDLSVSMDVWEGAMSGRTYIGTLSGSLNAPGLSGDLTIDHFTSGTVELNGPVSGSVTVRDPDQLNISGNISMGELTASGELTLDGSVAGSVALADLRGTVTIAGSLVDGGAVSVSNDLTGALIVSGDLGAGEGASCSISAGDLVSGGHIIVGGSLLETGGMIIGGASETVWDDEFMTIGYDGPPASWIAPATVTVTDGPQVGLYDWSAPEDHIFLVGCKRGDLNGDWVVDGDDLAIYTDWIYLKEEPQATFCTEYPWFCGAVDYLGNADCAGGLTGTWPEYTALLLKIMDPSQWYQQHRFCEMGCLGQGGGGFFFGGYDFEYGATDLDVGAAAERAAGEDGDAPVGMSAEEMAAALRAAVYPDRMPEVIALCQQAAAAATDADAAAFWAEVAAQLP